MLLLEMGGGGGGGNPSCTALSNRRLAATAIRCKFSASQRWLLPTADLVLTMREARMTTSAGTKDLPSGQSSSQTSSEFQQARDFAGKSPGVADFQGNTLSHLRSFPAFSSPQPAHCSTVNDIVWSLVQAKPNNKCLDCNSIMLGKRCILALHIRDRAASTSTMRCDWDE